MASIFKNKNFDSFGVEITVEKRRKRFYGFTSRKDAEKSKLVWKSCRRETESGN